MNRWLIGILILSLCAFVTRTEQSLNNATDGETEGAPPTIFVSKTTTLSEIGEASKSNAVRHMTTTRWHPATTTTTLTPVYKTAAVIATTTADAVIMSGNATTTTTTGMPATTTTVPTTLDDVQTTASAATTTTLAATSKETALKTTTAPTTTPATTPAATTITTTATTTKTTTPAPITTTKPKTSTTQPQPFRDMPASRRDSADQLLCQDRLSERDCDFFIHLFPCSLREMQVGCPATCDACHHSKHKGSAISNTETCQQLQTRLGMSDDYCNLMREVLGSLPKTSTTDPTTATTIDDNLCKDKTTPHYCNWLKSEHYCGWQEIRVVCPETCGVCGGNTGSVGGVRCRKLYSNEICDNWDDWLRRVVQYARRSN